MTTKRLKLAELLGTNVASTRSSLRNVKDSFFSSVAIQSQILLDFEGMQFLSRAFLHELLELKEEMERKKIFICFENILPECEQLLHTIDEQRKVGKDLKIYREDIPVLSFEEFLAL